MHDSLFLNSSKLADSELRQYAIDGGVDAMAFDSCLVNDATVSRRLDDDRELARSLGIVSTPSFFLGRVEPNGDLKVATVIAGARPVDYFIATVDKVIRVR
jgi:protein-disulfide isomerase